MKISYLVFVLCFSFCAKAQSDSLNIKNNAQPYNGDLSKPEATEFYEPVPIVIKPNSNTEEAPSDAIILFNGKDLKEWHSEKGKNTPVDWTVEKGILTVNKKVGGILTKRSFVDYQLHIEWKIPVGIKETGQSRGNSGIFLGSTSLGDDGYELQILDSYQNKTYVNGQAGSIYKQSAPLVNASRKPGEWQVYDIIWTAPRFDAKGNLESPAFVTVFHNGILVQNHFALKGFTKYIGLPDYQAHGALPIKLQAHGDPSEPISFRNIWIRPF